MNRRKFMQMLGLGVPAAMAATLIKPGDGNAEVGRKFTATGKYDMRPGASAYCITAYASGGTVTVGGGGSGGGGAYISGNGGDGVYPRDVIVKFKE